MATRRGRPQKPVEGSGLRAQHARRLRALVQDAETTLPKLRERTGYSLATLSKALGGAILPSWEVTSAILEACGAVAPDWKEAWKEAATEPPPATLRLVKNAAEPLFLPAPPRAPTPVDNNLAARITGAIAASPKLPNLLKLANELGISITQMQDTIDALGGFNAVWSNVRQDHRETDDDLAFYSPPSSTPRSNPRFAAPPLHAAPAPRHFGPAPIPLSANTVAEFNAYILRVQIWIGAPTVRRLAREMEVAPSTLQNLLHPKDPDRLPDHDRLWSFLRYAGIEPTAMSEWIFTWRRLKYAEVSHRRVEIRSKVERISPKEQPAPHADAA